jgi:1-acyl-sn-glycerol-3-phosphate acyltransferase
MKFLADLLYALMKLLVVISYRIFYSKTTVLHPERLGFKGPGIIISNHPSTLMDPLNTGIQTNRRLSFLANAGLFKNPAVAAFLNIYCIPVERPKDVNGRRINNEDNFARADEHLAKGKVIYIAPEGTSNVERRLRPLKTGTARIALSAESKQNFSLGLQIIPVGLTYTAPKEFRSEVLVNIGKPILLKEYGEAYKKRPFPTAKHLTADLQKHLQGLIFHTETEEMDTLLFRIQTVLQSQYPEKPGPHFLRSEKVLKYLKSLEESDFQVLNEKALSYFSKLKSEEVTDKAFYKTTHKALNWTIWILFIIGFPFFIYGWINNLLPFGVPGWIAHRLKIYHGYIPAAKTLGGLIFIPLFYYLQSKLVALFFGADIAWIYLLTLLPLGWLAWQYRQLWTQWIGERKAQRVKIKEPKIYEKLLILRNDFTDLLQPQFKGWAGEEIP